MIVFVLAGWWTFGVGNLVYALWKRLTYRDEPYNKKLEATEQKQDKYQNKIGSDDNADKDGNTPAKTITIEVDYGSSWSGSVGDETSQRSVNGTGPKEFEINPNSMVAVAVVQKQDDSINKMIVQIKQGNDIVAEGNTTAKYGVVSVNEPFYLRDLQLH